MRHTRLGTICTCAVALTVLGGSSALAQGPAAGKRQQIMKARQELQMVGAKLNDIQQAALKGNGKLRARRDKLQSMIEASMKKQGHDPDEGMKQMKALQGKLHSGKLSEKQKQETVAKLRQKGQALQMAQLRAMQDPKVKKVADAFRTRLEKAMIKQDPKAKKLLERFKELSNKLRSLMMQGRG